MIKSAKETYDHQQKVLKEELHCKNKVINMLLGIIEKTGNDKHETQPVPLINFENNLTSQIKLTAKSTLNQMSANKVTIINNKFPRKNSVRTVKKKIALTQF